MGKKTIIIIDDQEEGVQFSIRFAPATNKDEKSARIYWANRILRVIAEDNGINIDEDTDEI